MKYYTYSGNYGGPYNISTSGNPGFHLKWSNGYEVINYYHLVNGCNYIKGGIVHVPLVNWYFFVALTDDYPEYDMLSSSRELFLRQGESRDVDGNIDRIALYEDLRDIGGTGFLNHYFRFESGNYIVNVIRVSYKYNEPITNYHVEGKPSAGDVEGEGVLPDDIIDELQDKIGEGAVDQLFFGEEETTEEYTGTTEYETYSTIKPYHDYDASRQSFSSKFAENYSDLDELSSRIESNQFEVSSGLAEVGNIYDNIFRSLPTWLIPFIICGAIMIIAVKVTN